MNELLIVDDDAAMRSLLVDDLGDRGYLVETAASVSEAMAKLADHLFGCVVTDINLGGPNGLELTRAAVALDPTLPVIVITAFGSLDRAIEAIRVGAYDFITKPFEHDVLALSVQRAVSLRRLQGEVTALRRRVHGPAGTGLDGNSGAIERLENRLRAVAPTPATCLLLGESGSGKTRVARHLHDLSDRAGQPFVAENVAAIPEQLIESELFGHVRGAFTGATSARDGLLRRAARGTLFLDEIGELPMQAQAKLLRALDERRFRPVGSDEELAFEARLIVATNRDLQKEVRGNRFREDLFYRLSVFEVTVPPLRERGRDVLELAQRFLVEEAAKFGKQVQTIGPQVARVLMAHDWPGNVRELHNCIAQAVIVATDVQLHPSDLPERLRAANCDDGSAEVDGAPSVRSGLQLPDELDASAMLPLAEVERRHILRVLAAVEGNKALAARILGLWRKTLYRKLEAEGASDLQDDSAC